MQPYWPTSSINVNYDGVFCGNGNIALSTGLIVCESSMIGPKYVTGCMSIIVDGNFAACVDAEWTGGSVTNNGTTYDGMCLCWPNVEDCGSQLVISGDSPYSWNVNTDAWSVYWDVDERTNLFQELQSAISSLNQNNHQSVRNTVESLLHEIYLYFVRLELFLNTTIVSSSDPECAEFFTQKELFNTAKSELQEVAKAFGVYDQWWEEEPINPPVMSINTTRGGGNRLDTSILEQEVVV